MSSYLLFVSILEKIDCFIIGLSCTIVICMFTLFNLLSNIHCMLQVTADLLVLKQESELILGLRPANERRRYFVTKSLIG